MTADAVKSIAVRPTAGEASETASPPTGRARAGGQFRPDIEGLRTIAVGLVLAYHGFEVPFTGGFVGVDVFFVISGFLISKIILTEISEHRFSFTTFYGGVSGAFSQHCLRWSRPRP